MDTAARAHAGDPELSLQLTEQTRTILGCEAFLALLELSAAGKLPRPGSPGFGEFIEMAAAGDVEIATVVLVKEHEWVPTGRMAGGESHQESAPQPPAAPTSLKDDLTAMGLLGSSLPPLTDTGDAPSVRAGVLPDIPLPWPPPGRQAANKPPRLTMEIIPTSLHGQNPRTHFGREWWDATRRAAYAAAGYRCEICGGRGPRHPVELHERYSYDEHAHPPVQRITGLIVLCPACHAVKHMYRTGAVAAENNNRAVLDGALRHLREVNGWTGQQLDRYLAQVRREYERREAIGPWTADYSALSP
jgi:5-methylcytosine-specific restriction endonuclease McrA